jgi:hypothetical protein
MTIIIVRGQTRHFARGDTAGSGYGVDMPAQITGARSAAG